MSNGFDQIKVQFPLTNEDMRNFPFYLCHIGAMEHQHPCHRPEGLIDYQFLFCTSGKGHLMIEGTEYTISQGMGMYFRPGIAHEYYAIEEPFTTHWILFNGKAVDMIPSIQQFGSHCVFYVHAMEKLLLLHSKLYSSVEQNGLLNRNEVSLNLYQFLLEISDCVGETSKNRQQYGVQQLTQVITYMESNFNQDIILDHLASIAGFTPQHLCRLFQKTYHMRPMEYLEHYRMKHAKYLLTSNRDLTLKEIAAQIGYHDLSYFCAMFKKSEGMTPGEFRKNDYLFQLPISSKFPSGSAT